jgi:hypothetical protein
MAGSRTTDARPHTDRNGSGISMQSHTASRRASSALGSQASSVARRRLQRRAALFCGTNGCASILEVDPGSGVASCRICGYRRMIS